VPVGRRALLVLAVAVSFAVGAGAARADLVQKQDAQGRTITFDVQTSVLDIDWYANLLRSTAHGNEISKVTIRIVDPPAIRTLCGADALACWSKRGSVSTITVPSGAPTAVLEHSVVHEYGHHLDSTWAVAGVSELNGTPTWWASRGMGALVASSGVAFDYSLGWNRSIAEVFAEDYAYIHLGGIYKIPWLAPPDDALKTALLAELGGAGTTPPAVTPPVVTPPVVAPPVVTPPATTTPSANPVTVNRSGTLAAGARRAIPFSLLGAGRRVTADAAVSPLRRGKASARLDVVCNGTVVASTAVVSGRTARLDAPNLGPASCEATLVSTSTANQRYAVRLRLTIGS
jgi:hypothetical protein